LSAINYGYWEDPFFRFFNCTDPGRIRRTSLICRGYYVRFRVCDYFLRKFVRTMSEPIQVSEDVNNDNLIRRCDLNRYLSHIYISTF